jgi:hypothetical protein
MDIKVFDLKLDKKVNAKNLLIDITISDYIELIKKNIKELDIQRGKIISGQQVYKRLINDLLESTIIPPLSLVIKEDSDVFNAIKDDEDIQSIQNKLNEKIKPGDLSILDGLQRTYCILEIVEKHKEEYEKNNIGNLRIRAEVWYDINSTAILYKMLVLNTGQVKMSMKHQIEILNIPLKEAIIKYAREKGKEVFFSTYKNPDETDSVFKYKLSNVVEGFTAFLTRNPIVDKTNEVVKDLERMKFIEEHSSIQSISENKEIKEFADLLLKLDEGLSNKYKNGLDDTESLDDTEREEKSKIKWTSRNELMGSAPVISGIFAAFGWAFTKVNSYENRKSQFFNILSQPNQEDPLALRIAGKILEDRKKRSKKFGDDTRKFFFEGFKEFFNSGENFVDIWPKLEIAQD